MKNILNVAVSAAILTVAMSGSALAASSLMVGQEFVPLVGASPNGTCSSTGACYTIKNMVSRDGTEATGMTVDVVIDTDGKIGCYTPTYQYNNNPEQINSPDSAANGCPGKATTAIKISVAKADQQYFATNKATLNIDVASKIVNGKYSAFTLTAVKDTTDPTKYDLTVKSIGPDSAR